MARRRRSTGRLRAGSVRRRLPSHRRALRFEPLEDRRVLAVMTVTDLQDDTLANLAGDSQLSLREAIEAINTGTAVDGIGPTTGTFGVDDEIVFDASLFTGGGQSIQLVDGELTLTSEVTITGPGQDLLEIDAQEQSRIFDITSTAGDVTLAGLTLTNGQVAGDGGAIRSVTSGHLTIDHSTISDNTVTGRGGGIFVDSSGGDITITQSTIDGNTTQGSSGEGGGIFAGSDVGDVTITHSTISGNTTEGSVGNGGGVSARGANVTIAESTVSGNTTQGIGGGGGGVFASGYTTISGSTISGNTTAGSHGGGIYAGGELRILRSTLDGNQTFGPNRRGGGIYNVSLPGGGTTIITNSTISGNSTGVDATTGSISDGGGVFTKGDLTATHSTITGNSAFNQGGGIFAAGSIVIANSIVAGNDAGAGNPDVRRFSGSQSIRYNLIGSSSGLSLGPGNIVGQDPMLGSLADNGGPTPTHMIMPGSPAIDAGDPDAIGGLSGVPASDQRGNPFGRVGDGNEDGVLRIDMGAVEFLAPLVVNDAGDVDDGDPANDNMTLREAVNLINAGHPTNGIVMDPVLNGATISLAGSELPISQEVAITAAWLPEGLTIDGGDQSRIFDITALAGDFSFTNLTLIGGQVSATDAQGGAIRSLTSGSVMIVDSTIANSTLIGASTAAGGGIYAAGPVHLKNSTLSGNSSSAPDSRGGALYALGAITAEHSTIAFNDAGEGGGLWNDDDIVTIHNTIVAENSDSADSPDLRPGSGALDVQYSLIGDDGGLAIGGIGNVLNQVPMLGPLSDNNGALIHALLVGSPAIRAGDPNAVAGVGGVPLYDQRGAPFVRVFGGRIDIGAFEGRPDTFVVSTLGDGLDGNYGLGQLTLRDVVAWANENPGSDTITFDASLDGGIIELNGTELELTDAVSIDASTLANGLTIDAQQQSRIFNLTATTGDFTLDGLTLTGGQTTGDNQVDHTYSGGTIRSLSAGELAISRSSITNSHATGDSTVGGGVFAYGNVTLTQSTISGNSSGGSGGGILAGVVTLTQSTVSRNSAGGNGGGIWAGYVTLTQSTISGNSAGNDGGGIDANDVILAGSIVAGNTAVSGGPDFNSSFAPDVTAEYSLIGDGSGATITDNGGNQIGTSEAPINPLLGPLADNGGPTRTHALLAGSPAIDAGDPTFTTPPDFDQRGAPFVRVFDGDGMSGARIDIGAYERQTATLPALVVDTTADVSDGDYSAGNFSLREALGLANGSIGPDSITFAPALSGQTILLTLGEMTIADAVTIDATPLVGGFTIDAQEQSRILNIDDGGGANDFDVTLAGLMLTQGQASGAGGAIRSSTTGTLTINESTISYSHSDAVGPDGGGGIFAAGDLALTDSTVSDNTTDGLGGGIESTGNVTLTDSTVSENMANGPGGGLYTTGNAILTGSTIDGNMANDNGGGIWASSLTLTQSTVSGNTATTSQGGGIFAADAVIFQSTISGNTAVDVGGGVYITNDLTLSGSIVAGNTAAGGNPDLRAGTGTPTVEYSLIGDTAGLSGSQLDAINAGAGNLLNLDPVLGPLADNGGPTFTHALLPGSPAIDAGDPAAVAGMNGVPDFDQRAAPFDRVIDIKGGGARIDMGAYELQAAPTALVVDTVDDELDLDFSPGNLSLREAIGWARTLPAFDTITFDASLDGGTLLLGLGQLQIADAVTIDATSLADGFTIDAEHNSRILDIDGEMNDFDVAIAGLALTRGQTTGDSANALDPTYHGGAIRSLTTGSLTFDGSSITDSHVTGIGTYGGGIYARGDVSLAGSTISGNSSASRGGGLVARLGDVSLSQSTVSGNSTGGGSGGILANYGDVTLTESTVSGNSADSSTGGVYARENVTLTRSTVSGNSAGGNAGGIQGRNGIVTLTQSTVSGNSAGGFGGGVFGPGPSVVINGSIVAGNSAGSIGPDVTTLGGSTTATYSLIGDGSTFVAITNVGDSSQIGTSEAPINPLLGPLADNGGPTLLNGAVIQTHALLPGSPALDAGNSSLTTDQRGLAVPIDLAGIANAPGGNGGDIGAYEAQTQPSADFVDDDVITGLDFLAWQIGFGTTVGATRADGDSDGDGDVDPSDLAAWELTYGQVDLAPLAAATTSGANELASPIVADETARPVARTASTAELVDVALAVDLSHAVPEDVEEAAPEVQPASLDAAWDRGFHRRGFPPAGPIADDLELPSTRSSQVEAAEAPWLTEELLERVFG